MFRLAADAKSAENGSLITIPPKRKKVKHFLKIFIYNIENGKLCDRINQCKSLEELKGWERTFSYHPILKDDQDYDYCFFLDLMK